MLGGSWLFDEVGALQLSHESEAFVCAIDEPVGYLNPLAPSTGVTGEITDLIFDPLLIRDEDLNLRPHLIESWTSRTVVTVRCSSEEAAGESEAKLRSGEYLPEGMKMLALDRTGSVLTVVCQGMETGLEEKLIAEFDPANLGDYLLVSLKVDHSVRDSFEAFLKGSVEKTQIRMIEYVGDRELNLFVRGDTDLFLRELELYYEANPALEPHIEVMGERSYTTAREMLIDLKERVRWHDGASFDSADVIFSYEELTRPDSPLPLASSFAFVESVRALTPLRIKVECREVPATMMESWEKLPVLPSHLLTRLSGPGALDAFFANPVGTGPYQLATRRRDGGVELIANEGYFRGAPLEKRIGYRHYRSLESILLALRSDRVEVIVPDERFTDWSNRNSGAVSALQGEPRIQHFVAWNLERTPFDRNPVRLALAKAVDSGELLRNTPTEFQQPVTSLFYPGIPYCDSPMELPLHDPRGAENLLDAEGYKRAEGNGLRKDGNGDELQFTLAVNEANPEHCRLAAALAEQWLQVGVRVEVEEVEWGELLTERLLTRDFDAVFLSWEVPYERDRYRVWHSSEAGPGEGNVSGLRDPVVDEILEKLRREEDPDEVKICTARLQEAIARLQPCFFVCETGRILTVRSGGVEVFRPEKAGGKGERRPLAMEESRWERNRPWWVRGATGTRSETGPASLSEPE
ncbi:MAG: hypothetical protein GXX91_12405 [Verrucomicrobiaceae bacterium]|nr:hypothetical protein [Verrucomicrobiaceae bacterium]